MLPLLRLLAKQVVIVMVSITVYLLISRQIGVAFYQSESLMILVVLLTVFVVIGAIQGVFVRPWWLYLLGSSVLALPGVSCFIFPLIDLIVPGSTQKMGPGGIVFLVPMLTFIYSYPLGGVLQWVKGMAAKSGGSK